MPGFKQSIREKYNPSLFLTFDGDPFDPVNRTLLTVPQQIMDESGNGNNGILHTDSDEFHGYRMGLPSLVQLEPTDQHSIAFGWYGRIEQHPAKYPKAYIEVPHSQSLSFPNNSGSFTLSFMLQKQSRDTAYRNEWGGSTSISFTRPIIRKESVFTIRYDDRLSLIDRLIIENPSGTFYYDIDSNWAYGEPMFFTFVYGVSSNPESLFDGNATLYLNGRIVGASSQSFFDSQPATNIGSPVEIGGFSHAPGTHFTDRNVSALLLDQIALYNRTFSPDEVIDLYKKTVTYETMITRDRPSFFIPMQDQESTTSFVADKPIGGGTALLLGNNQTILREQAGTPNILTSRSIRFVNGGSFKYHHGTTGSPTNLSSPFSPTGDYTYEYWFNVTGGERGILFSQHSETNPFNGLTMQMNMFNNNYLNGCIQVNISKDEWLTSNDIGGSRFYNNGQWNHLVLTRKDNIYALWLNGQKRAEKQMAMRTPSGPIYMLSIGPNKLEISGFLSYFAGFTKTLQDQQIKARYIYQRLYMITGRLTFQGAPYRGTIRYYKFHNGEKLGQVTSNINNGDYIIYLHDNTWIDLFVLNENDRSVRPRAYGPIVPAELNDDI